MTFWWNPIVWWIRQRIEEAQARSIEAGPATEALARGEGDIPAWIQRLRAVTLRHTHRTGAISADHLWPVLESPGAKPMERAAAAVALGGELDERSRQRIAQAASATASPRLRVVLDAVHEGAEDDALAEAVAALEAEEAQASA